MNLREAFDEDQSRRPGGVCRVCVALESMPDDDAATLRELLDSGATHTSISRACVRAGYESLTVPSISRHRQGDCVPLSY